MNYDDPQALMTREKEEAIADLKRRVPKRPANSRITIYYHPDGGASAWYEPEDQKRSYGRGE